MMMMLMNCFCDIVDQQKAFSLISGQNHWQRSLPLWIWHVMSRICIWTKPKFKLWWIELSSSDKHYTKTLVFTNFQFQISQHKTQNTLTSIQGGCNFMKKTNKNLKYFLIITNPSFPIPYHFFLHWQDIRYSYIKNAGW